ncbi:hypothetical protein N7493_006224 [Penicillium malachiteum]|uniref:Uncharacterized protein n=1 Tax=Penicillium malachiteum TaxID=1324776 RepID=A0AAD6HKI5_9EURO|nr:hypothetical protein N7493_006224 [Penicillium malachiteum]
MSKNYTRSIASAGSESVKSVQQRTLSPRVERSASNPASFSLDANHYDTALPPIQFSPSQNAIAHRRTGSTLKTVMRKIFNRKRQSQADGLEENPNEAFYPSVLGKQSSPAAGKTFLAIPAPSELKRSSPLSEENLQLQFAEAHLSPTSAKGGSLPSPGIPRRRRRATLPSVIFSDDESRFAVASSAISAISDPQEDRPRTQDTLHRRHSMLQNRRISRSTDALHELAHEQPVVDQTPSFWPPRSTSIPTSVPDSKSPALEVSSASDHSARPSTGTTVTSLTRESVAPSASESDPQADQMSLPPNVRSLVHTMQQDDGLTVEQRLNTLEVKMIDLEFAIARMQSSPVDPHYTERSSRQRHTPSSEPYSPHSRSKYSAGYLSSSDRERERERERERDESPTPLTTFSAVRPPSTSTIRPDTMSSRIRPAPSTTSLSEFSGVSIEQYSTLVTLLRREQTARRNLESQVSGLRDDLRQLQRAALHSMEMGTMYPIHNVDSQEFLRFRRALDDSDCSSPNPAERERERAHAGYDGDSNWGPDDPIGPHKWDQVHGPRAVQSPMI